MEEKDREVRKVEKVSFGDGRTRLELAKKKFLEEKQDDRRRADEEAKLEKIVKVLDQLGFGSSSSNKPLLTDGLVQGSKKKYSIGLADFWTMQEKFKYLKDKGYWNAYKKLLYEKNLLHQTHKKSPNNPDLPYIMDHKAKRVLQPQSPQPSLRQNLTETRLSQPKSPYPSANSNPTLQKLQQIQDRCKTLFTSTLTLKKTLRSSQKSSIQQVLTPSQTPLKPKLNKTDRSKIKRIISCFSK